VAAHLLGMWVRILSPVNDVCCGGRDICKGANPHTGKFYYARTHTQAYVCACACATECDLVQQ